MDDAELVSPELCLTKTEAFVVDCRKRGMSDTAIRRLLQLSAAEAVALGLIPAQPTDAQSNRQACNQGPGVKFWPQREGRRGPFARRLRQQAAQRRSYARRRQAQRLTPTNQSQSIRKDLRKIRGDNV